MTLQWRQCELLLCMSSLCMVMVVMGQRSEVLSFLSSPLMPPLPWTAFEERHRYRCDFDAKESALRRTKTFHWRGTSLGGYLVLEPWITPSLFYQFLDATKKWGKSAKDHVALDSKSFCTALGSAEAKRQLQLHWATWVSEEHIEQLVAKGIDTLRIPIADWMFFSYSPFTDCWDGAIEALDRVLDWSAKHRLQVVLDLHALRGSQNGLDNSGDTGHYQWYDESVTVQGVENSTSSNNSVNQTVLRYEHWRMRGGDWAGPFDPNTQQYQSINETNILHSLDVIYRIVTQYKDHPAIVGFEPVNEPSAAIPFDVLQEFYWRSLQIVHHFAPHWTVLFHDSFRLSPENWVENGFLEGCAGYYAVDTHLYLAWDDPQTSMQPFVEKSCAHGQRLREMERLGVPVVVGEWSLATDNCALWLNGFNDNVPGYPKVECTLIRCPDPYFGLNQIPNAPPDATVATAQDPFGAGGASFVINGMCPIDKRWDNEVEVVRSLALAQLHAYDVDTHGFFFWNFRTELETRWDYLKSVENGWLPANWTDPRVRYEVQRGCASVSGHNDSPATTDSSPPVAVIAVIAATMALLALGWMGSLSESLCLLGQRLWNRLHGYQSIQNRDEENSGLSMT